jgi:c(7)-type cytochrome triheme protein
LFTAIAVALVAAACSPTSIQRFATGRIVDEPRPRPPEAKVVAEPVPRPEGPPPEGPWLPLERDGLHDPANPALAFLQQPSEALSVLPPAREGDRVDWVQALRTGSIEPRTNIYPGTEISVLDLDVPMPDTAGMPMVLFAHRPHTEWLDCTVCHDKIFKQEAGANPVNMQAILQGEFCGQCHGAVAFPLTQCRRCHNVQRTKTAPIASGNKQG